LNVENIMIFEIVWMGMEWGQIIVSVSLFSKQFIVLPLVRYCLSQFSAVLTFIVCKKIFTFCSL